MRAKTKPETLRKVENTARMTLEKWLGDELVFGLIIAEPWFDIMDNEEYIHMYIVFEGDYKRLDPRFDLRTARNFSRPAPGGTGRHDDC